MTRSLLLAVGALASAGAVASAQRTPQMLQGAIPVEPLRIAPATLGPDGPRLAGDWMPYQGAGPPRGGDLVFDCIEHTGNCQPDGYLYLGTGYCNMFWTNDMTLADDTVTHDGASRIDFAWFWTVQGWGSSETCIIAVFTQDSVPCEPDSFDYGGWLIDYGTLLSSVGSGYYYSEVDIDPDAWPLPTSGQGSYAMLYLQAVTTSGAWVLATCAQPMLWGTGEDRGDPMAPGEQGPLQLDDDEDIDGSHSSEECHSYADAALCPTELGAAAGLWGNRYTPGCYWMFPNCDGDDKINTQDFLCFLHKWAGAYQSGEFDPEADCDQDGSITTQDFLCFLNRFVACRNG